MKYTRGHINNTNFVLGIYGKTIKKKHCRAYCKLHSCYLGGLDIVKRKCSKKKCRYLKQIKGNYYG